MTMITSDAVKKKNIKKRKENDKKKKKKKKKKKERFFKNLKNVIKNLEKFWCCIV